MNDESGFLEAIRQSPDDASIHAVFADWLASRGDPRARLIRLEQARRQHAPHTAAYWRDADERRALWADVDPAFLWSLGYLGPYRPVFGHPANDWRSRFRLLRAFVERWFGLALGDVGRVPAEAYALGPVHLLGPAVVEWIALTEDIAGAEGSRAVGLLRDGRRIAWLEEHDALSLNLQAEGDLHWAVPRAALSADDPPVHLFLYDYDEGGGFVPYDAPGTHEVSVFATTYLLSYARGAVGWRSAVDDAEALAEAVRAEGQHAQRLGNTWIMDGPGWFAIMERTWGDLGVAVNGHLRVGGVPQALVERMPSTRRRSSAPSPLPLT